MGEAAWLRGGFLSAPAGKNPALAKFERRAMEAGTLVCVGLDPDLARLPERWQGLEHPLFAFNKWIIDETAPFAAAYKPNMAFYEARGVVGLRELELTAEYLRERYPEMLTICDAKRGDIGSTNRGYVASIFDGMGFDAITLHPYLGREALMPFLERAEKLSILLCRTSNPGAGELQDLMVDGKPLWEYVAGHVAGAWNEHGNCMLVVGATYPEEMRRIRAVAPELSFLVPGVGAQGGDVDAVVGAGVHEDGAGLIISSSRAILYASDPAAAAKALRDEIRTAQARASRTDGELQHAAH
jgi:orotidine-5'-phosphate decarboxylase